MNISIPGFCGEIRVLDTSDLPGTETIALTPKFLANIQKEGLQSLIVVEPTDPETDRSGYAFRILAGRRRLAAFRALEYSKIPAIVVPRAHQDRSLLHPEEDREPHTRSVTLSENLARSRNYIAELEAFETLVSQGMSREQIAKTFGLLERELKQLDRLRGMSQELRAALALHQIAPSTALVLATLNHQDQDKFLAMSDRTLKSARLWKQRVLIKTDQFDFLDQDLPHGKEVINNLLSGAHLNH